MASEDYSAISIHQKYATAATALNSILTNSIITIPEYLQQDGVDTVLTLGSTGDIQFLVQGYDNMGRMSVDEDNVLNFSSKDVLWISGNDTNKTVGVSRTTFTYDAYQGKNIIDAGQHQLPDGLTMKKKFEMDARVTKFTGSAQVGGDIITNGHIISRSMNIGLVEDSNISIGFGFRVTDNHTLELYKYDRSNNFTSRIATFGEGSVKKNDAFSNFPVFAESNYEPNDQLMLGDNTSPLWEAEGANIFYLEGKVLVGTSNATDVMDYSIEIKNKMYVEKAIVMGSSGLTISGNSIQNAENLSFVTSGNDDPIIFNGNTSTLHFDSISDTNNSTWIKNNQNSVLLGGFSNDLSLESFYKGTGKTWFDYEQPNVLLTSFSNDLVDFNYFDVNTLNADTLNVNVIKFLDNPQSNVFNGEISGLAGISNFKLSEFDDDILYKVDFGISNLTLDTIVTDLIPHTHDLQTIGSDTSRFSTVNTSTINIGNPGENSNVILSYQDDNLNVSKQLFLQKGILFPDGSTISSFSGVGGGSGERVNELINPTVQVYKNGNNYESYSIRGTFQFSITHSKIRTEMSKLYVYNILNGDASILLPDSEGNINLSGENVKLIHEQNNIHFSMDLLNEDNTSIEGGLYLTPYEPQDGNEIINLKVFMPNTTEFSQKFKADFDFFYNDRMLLNPFDKNWSVLSPWGTITGEVTLGESVKYIPKPINDGKYLVEHISYFILSRLPEDDTPLSSYNTSYFTANNIQDRMNGIWYYKAEDSLTHFMKNDYYLLPKISLINWKNTMDNLTTSRAAYETFVNWFDTNGSVNIARFDPELLKSLLTITLAYIKYGAITEVSEEDYTNIDVKAAQFTSEDFEIITSDIGNSTTTNGIRINISNVFVYQNDVLYFKTI